MPEGGGGLTGGDRPVKLNQIIRMSGINFNSFFQHMTILRTSAFRPAFFETHKTSLENIKLTYLYDYVLHEQWRNIWVTRADLARRKVVSKRGKQELETKLQQFAWILFTLCKARFLERFDPSTAFPLLVCCTSLVIEAYSATVDPPPPPTGSAAVGAAAAAAAAAAAGSPPPPTPPPAAPVDPLDFFVNIATASNPAKPKKSAAPPPKPTIPVEETDVHASVLSLIVPELANVIMSEVTQYVDRVQDLVDELAEKGHLLRENGPTPAARARGLARDTLRAICAPKKLSSNGYNLSKLYNKSHQRSICNLDETIFLDHIGMQKSIHARARLPQESGSLVISSSSSQGIPGSNDNNSVGNNGDDNDDDYDDEDDDVHKSTKRRCRGGSDDYSDSDDGSESYPLAPSSPARPRTSMEDKVQTSNWMLKVVNSRIDGPSGEVVRFFQSCPNGDALLDRAQRQLQRSVETFIRRLSGGGATADSPSEQVRALQLSASQALRLFWSVLGDIVAQENARRLPSFTESSSSSSPSLSSLVLSHTQQNIAKFLGDTNFHRAMLACATEIVLVANGQLSYLFPRSALAFGVTPFQLFKALDMFVRFNGKSLPERLKLHLMWCDEQLIVVHAWIAEWGGVPVPGGDGIFTLMCDHRNALHSVRTRSMRGSKANQAGPASQTNHGDEDDGNKNNDLKKKQKNNLPPQLVSFMHRLEKLAAKRLNQLCHLLGFMGAKSLGEIVHALTPAAMSAGGGGYGGGGGGGGGGLGGHISAANSGHLSNRELIDQMWTLLKFVFYDCWWLMRNRHLDQMIMCCVYAVCKWQNRGVMFHTIAQHYCALPASISSGAGIDFNFEEKMEMVNSCDMDCLDNAQDCCLSEGQGKGSIASAGDAVPVKGTLVEFYNREFLPRTQDFLTELQNDGGKHGGLITEFPSHRDERPRRFSHKKRKMVDRENATLVAASVAPPTAAAVAVAAAAAAAAATNVEGQMQPLKKTSAHVKELIKMATSEADGKAEHVLKKLRANALNLMY
jgi:hypothetical protein